MHIEHTDMMKKIARTLLITAAGAGLFLVCLTFSIYRYSQQYIYTNSASLPRSFVALVPGAKVYHSGYPSIILRDRLYAAIALYKKKKVTKFLLSGDHGTVDYDEVNNMKKVLLKEGIPAKDIFLDHAGFDTYDSIVRAQKIFQVQQMVIVTQNFHLRRALFIARMKGLTVYGFQADQRAYRMLRYYQLREVLANVKACLELMVYRSPAYLGRVIPITGDSRESWD